MNKEMKYIRVLIMMMALMWGAVSGAWAQLTASDIEYEVKPIASAGTVSPSVSERTVTLTVTPATGYFIKASDFVVEKLVNTGKANAPKRRVSDITNLITGKLYSGSGRAETDIISSVTYPNSAQYVFTVPTDYDGAYVTATFHLETEGDIIRITASTSLGDNPDMTKHYVLVEDVSASVLENFNSETPFTGTFEGEAKADGTFPKITGLSTPLFNTLTGTVKNIMLEGVGISNHTGNTGAIACTANGAARIYNVGILSGSVGGTDNTGGLVGFLDGTARVINCYSFANIASGTNVAGIVGNNNQTSSQTALNTIVVNCMFYGNITGGTSVYPVYGGRSINNDSNTGINPYCYFRKNATLTPTAYNRSWPAEEKNLTRFEYYRSVLNSNRKLCTWWVNGTSGTAPTDEDVANVGIAKWVLDPSIAPYPILKKWGKYPSVINLDPDKVWDPRTEIKEGDAVTSVTPHWVQRSDAKEWEGKSYGTLAVTIKAGAHGSGSTSRNIPITDMDTLNCDYSYYKIQLPYYNEVFGNPNGATHAEKYGGNYTEYVVTGWEIEAAGSTTATDYNFADRNSINGRVFAQGGYYYVPKDVTSITIIARWGKAFYLSNRGRSIDRVNVTKADYKADSPFTPAGTIPDTFQDQPVYDDLQNAIKALGTNTDSPTVYDQAIVLIGNHQVKNGNNDVGYNLDSKWHPFTIMSADFDFDNEPDYSFQFQFRVNTPRPGIQPIRFDFLPVVELGLALRHDYKAYAIGIFVPQGHFEVTETAFMRTTQFEYDGFQSYTDRRIEAKSPVIINGGEYEMFVVRYHDSDRTNYFLLGGNAWIHRFAPGAHPSNASPKIYLCPINVIGGQVKELYLTGLYRPELPAPTNQGAPRCYTDGGKFDIMAGAGYDKVEAGSNVTFKINHSKITEFYGGGINGTNPISGNIDVTINNSYVDKYCGGPKVGDMTGKTVTTNATGTIFGVFFGGGNGGNSYYRQLQKDGDQNSNHIGTWTDLGYNWNGFNPLGVKDDGTDNKGYHAEYEFEVFNHSNGVTDQITQRGFIRWIQFGITKTGNVSSTLSDCKILGNFYGGGNLATVDGNVTSTLTNTQVAGSVFGAGYSAAIPTFQVHDKSTVSFPSITAGVITDGYIGYDSKVYEWTNEKLEGKDEAYMKAHPTYEKDGKWYCYTWNSLDNLGAVTGNVTLTIDGNTTLTDGKVMKVAHSVYGGGEESAVNGNTSVTVTGGTIGTANEGGAEYGNVYGGGKGKADDVTAGIVKGSTNVSISGSPTILHNVYGGGAYGSVGDFTYDATSGMPIALATENTGVCNIAITGGIIGTNGKENGMIFGSSRGDVATPEGEPAVDPNDRMAWVYSTNVTIGTQSETPSLTTPKIAGSIYGSGENGHTFQNTEVTIHSGTIGIAEGETITDDNGTPDDISDDKTYSGAAYPYRGNVYGGGCGTDMYWIDANGNGEKDDGEKHYNPIAGIVRGNATVTIDGGHVVRNVYGAGAMGSVGNETEAESASTSGKTIVTIKGKAKIGVDGNDNGNVYGAARGDLNVQAENYANVRETELEINENADIKGSAFGGGEAGIVWESVAVNMKGGSVANDVYGGGALANTQVAYTIPDNAEKDFMTTVNLTGGTIGHNVYGGGLGRMADETKGVTAVEAKVYGKVVVALNGTKTVETVEEQEVTSYKDNCVVKGSIFGCNNQNGSPQDAVTVHIYKTTGWEGHAGTASDKKTSTTAADHSYHLAAVYGGGNLAAFIPDKASVLDTLKTHVIIDGCDMTSIRQVYGGGNAASVPATDVLVNGTYEIEEVFGGGNGKDDVSYDGGTTYIKNPGANVGYMNYTLYDDSGNTYDDPNYDTKEERTAATSSVAYGSGAANVTIGGGTIHRVFGGSNTKGNVRITAVTMLEEAGGCDFCVDEAYGGGKEAPMDAEAKLLMACIPGLTAAYGGAQEANIEGGVTLTITNGTFDRVFGGNNISGTISGPITVNIEETGCRPIVIGKLYGGGNEAAYSVYGYDADGNANESGSTKLYADPVVNIKSFTSIGEVYGGGYGTTAVMVGSPTVNINVAEGKHNNTEIGENATTATFRTGNADAEGGYPIPSHVNGKIGAINNVYGGGDAAPVKGDTYVNIATKVGDDEYMAASDADVKSDTSFPKDYYTRSGEGTEDSPYTYTAATGTTPDASTTYYKKYTIKGVDIRGNVYGGGNQAEVTGDTHVQIGKKVEP